jgi:hypothetical protein
LDRRLGEPQSKSGSSGEEKKSTLYFIYLWFYPAHDIKLAYRPAVRGLTYSGVAVAKTWLQVNFLLKPVKINSAEAFR